MKRLSVFTIAFALFSGAALFPLAACQGSPDADAVTIGITTAIERAVRGEYDYDMLASGNSETPLVYQDPQGAFHPLLADYFTADSKSWTYTVKQNMKWSNGEPVTAEDILFTLQYEDAHGGNYLTGDGKKYESYALSDDKTSLTLMLQTPNVRELNNMTTFRVMPKHVYEGKADAEVTEADGRIVCGPYVLKEFNRAAGTLTYDVNPFYPTVPEVKRLVYQYYSNPDTMYLALSSGKIDAVWSYSQGVPKTYAETLQNQSGVTLMTATAANAPAVLMFNCSKAPFDDKNVRNAVSYALDYPLFASTFGRTGADVPRRGFAPESTTGYSETSALEKNLTRATELLEQSGYQKAENAKYFTKNGQTLSFALTVRSSNATHLRVAELVKTELETFGIQVNLDAVDANLFNVKTSNKFAGENGGTVSMQAAVNGFTAAGMGMANGLGSIYVQGSHPVQGGCQVFDTRLNEILTEMNSATALEQYSVGAAKLQTYYAEEVPLIALYRDDFTYAYNTRLTGVKADAVFGINNIFSWLSVSID